MNTYAYEYILLLVCACTCLKNNQEKKFTLQGSGRDGKERLEGISYSRGHLNHFLLTCCWTWHTVPFIVRRVVIPIIPALQPVLLSSFSSCILWMPSSPLSLVRSGHGQSWVHPDPIAAGSKLMQVYRRLTLCVHKTWNVLLTHSYKAVIVRQISDPHWNFRASHYY